jgi:hypothetical protein
MLPGDAACLREASLIQISLFKFPDFISSAMISFNRQVILRELRDILVLLIVGFSMAVVMGYTKSPKQFILVGSFVGCMWVMLWKGNSYLSELLSSYINWLESPVKTFLVGMLATVIYTVGSVFILVKVFETFFSIDFGDITYMLYSSVVITIIITFFMHGRSFLLSWKETAVDAEKLKRENVTARYESLKNQVNPHFLFNSLNALTNLVYENQDLAVRFIKQLSEVYRYVLDTHDQELVSKEEELKFLNSYLFLQKIRFGENLRVDIALEGVETRFPPLVLQMLIENAIKHNTVSAESPLEIKIYSTETDVIVENKLQEKQVIKEESSGIGLTNIGQRYEFLSGKEIQVDKSETHFTVRLPILKVS